MTITLFAQPYDICGTGFYFETAEEYDRLSAENRNEFGEVVEEYEIQFIDGDDIDADLAKVFGLNQASFRHFLEAPDDYSDDEKIAFIIAVGECGYSVDRANDADIDIYPDTNNAIAQPVSDGIVRDAYLTDGMTRDNGLCAHLSDEGT